MNKNYKITIVLVNWNRSDDTLNCINSIHKSTYKNIEVVVVDNGSISNQLEKLKESIFNFKLIVNGENLGYTGGNNIGMKYAINNNSDYILLLNNDTFIDENAIHEIMQVAEKDEQIGILCPKIMFHPDRDLIWAAGTHFNHRYLMGYLRGYKQKDEGNFDEEIDLDYATGCALVIKKNVIEKIGYLSNDYFAVCEDLEYCLKVKNTGFKIIYVPLATIWHIESASSGGHDSPQYVYYQTRNYFIFHKNNSQGIFQLILSQSYYMASILKRGFYFAMQAKWRGLLAILLGIIDFILGRYGRQDYFILKKK